MVVLATEAEKYFDAINKKWRLIRWLACVANNRIEKDCIIADTAEQLQKKMDTYIGALEQAGFLGICKR